MFIFFLKRFFSSLRVTAECFARLSYGLGVCLSVRLSHCCIVSKRCKLGSRNLYFGCPQKTLVYRDKILRPGWGGFLQTRTTKGTPLKDAILPLLALIVWKRLQIGTYLLHFYIITSTGDGLFRFVKIDDLERPWNPKEGFWWIFRNFWLQRTI